MQQMQFYQRSLKQYKFTLEEKKFSINDLTFCLKELEKHKNPKVRRRKEIINIRVVINETETKNKRKEQRNQELIL